MKMTKRGKEKEGGSARRMKKKKKKKKTIYTEKLDDEKMSSLN